MNQKEIIEELKSIIAKVDAENSNEEKGTYNIRKYCFNCHSRFGNPLEIPLGISVESFLIDNFVACSICGCRIDQ